MPILLLVDPAEGGDELCSVAPPEVSALPDGGMVADLDTSGGTVAWWVVTNPPSP